MLCIPDQCECQGNGNPPLPKPNVNLNCYHLIVVRLGGGVGAQTLIYRPVLKFLSIVNVVFFFFFEKII